MMAALISAAAAVVVALIEAIAATVGATRRSAKRLPSSRRCRSS